MSRFGWNGLILAGGLLLVLGGAGCGYRFQSAGAIPAGLEPIYIEVFENRTSQAGLETTVTNAVVAEFSRRSPFALSAGGAGAGAVMKGVIRSVELKTIASRGRDVAGQRRVTLSLEVRLVRADGKAAWAVKNLVDNEAFGVSNDKFANEDLQRAALATVAARLAERIYNRLTDDF